MAQQFELKWGLPQCIGAVDGSHIPILAPQEYHTEYYNRKGWYSIVLQAVVNSSGQFWNIYTGQPGSLHDARVLRLSALWDLAESGQMFAQETVNINGQAVGYYILVNTTVIPGIMRVLCHSQMLLHNHKLQKQKVQRCEKP
ncbi:hypothetical protein WMY93_015181 [Mugilogobius chulae]|uniref:DDE Tnp4 domain-containing protein n=1 Tax=Mugilogobius chulae TaxID=88201 RepID=A0AAW0P998_9GOBI